MSELFPSDSYLENLSGLPFLSSLPSGVCLFSLSCFICLLLMGRLADLMSLASIAIPSFIVRPCFSNWRSISLLIWSIIFLGNLDLNREKVE